VSGNIQLLISDVIMPEMNGKQLADALRRISPNIKHLFISGYTANTLAPKGVLDQETNFIEKPYSRSQLGQKIREVLQSPPQRDGAQHRDHVPTS
jgi:YesN/AraC family two-component response regulator